MKQQLHELALSEVLEFSDPVELLAYIADWYEHEAERLMEGYDAASDDDVPLKSVRYSKAAKGISLVKELL